MARFWTLLWRSRRDGRVVAALMAANVAGIVYGYLYYHQVGQFDPASPYFRSPGWWPLVADSPNAVLLMSAALLVHRLLHWRSRWLDAAAFLLMVYVGVWTTVLFLLYPDTLGTWAWSDFPGNVNPLLFVSHMLMPLEALVLVPDMATDSWRTPDIAAVLAACTLFVWVDYWGPHLHPGPFLHARPGGDGALHATSPWVMASTAFAWVALALLGRRLPDRPSAPPGPT